MKKIRSNFVWNFRKLAILSLMITICVGTTFFACQKHDSKDNTGLLLLILASRNSGSSGSGFFITIPDGVAK